MMGSVPEGWRGPAGEFHGTASQCAVARLVPAANGETDLGRRRDLLMAHGLLKRFGLGMAVAGRGPEPHRQHPSWRARSPEAAKKENQNQGRSWCSFSGLNDDPTAPLDGSGPNGPGRSIPVVRPGEQVGNCRSAYGEFPASSAIRNHTPLSTQPEQDALRSGSARRWCRGRSLFSFARRIRFRRWLRRGPSMPARPDRQVAAGPPADNQPHAGGPTACVQ
jgi:hypothetical protein